jgi:hypothetical protein
MTIEQIVEVTENGVLRLEFPLPPEIPVGARVNVTVTPDFINFPAKSPSTREAIERCHGLGKRMGSRLTSESAIEMRRNDRKLEEEKYQRLFVQNGDKN